jgi:His/Glu/Gln/Arg/opine family amino acid ABC transporter permease subunit
VIHGIGSWSPLLVVAYDWDFSVVWPALPTLFSGLLTTIGLTVAVTLIAIPIGLVVALARLSRLRALRLIAYVYTELFRSTPLLILILWFYFVPGLAWQINVDAFAGAVAAFAVNNIAFTAEFFRACITSVDRGQREAALSTGMTESAVMRTVVLPQAVRRSIPLLASNWISLFKDTSLVAVIGLTDLMYNARALAVQTYRPLEILTVAAVMYFVLTYPQALLVDRLFERVRIVE